MKHTVKVWDKPHEVSVVQRSKTVWEAVGDCMGEALYVKGRTETAALKAWRDAATYKSG